MKKNQYPHWAWPKLFVRLTMGDPKYNFVKNENIAVPIKIKTKCNGIIRGHRTRIWTIHAWPTADGPSQCVNQNGVPKPWRRRTFSRKRPSLRPSLNQACPRFGIGIRPAVERESRRETGVQGNRASPERAGVCRREKCYAATTTTADGG